VFSAFEAGMQGDFFLFGTVSLPLTLSPSCSEVFALFSNTIFLAFFAIAVNSVTKFVLLSLLSVCCLAEEAEVLSDFRGSTAAARRGIVQL
jgi:hypothetical protein